MKVKIEGMKTKIRIGTRSSALSIAQSMLVAEAMKRKFPQVETELVCRKTVGDRILDKPLLAFGGKGVFVSEFEEALLAGEIDFAVHSAKDLPVELAEGLEIVGVLPRGDVRDALVMMRGERLWENGRDGKDKEGRGPGVRRIGTSSLRRRVQLEELSSRLWPGREVVVENLRGNVLSRLKRLENGEYDGIILAAAGLERLGILEEKKGVYEVYCFSEREMIPAGGQGILVIEGRREDEVNQLAGAVSDDGTMLQLLMERRVLNYLKAGCHEPVGVYCELMEGKGRLWGMYEKDGKRRREVLEFAWDKAPEEVIAWAAAQMAARLSG